MKSALNFFLVVFGVFSIQSCSTLNDDGKKFDLKVIIIGFDHERVILRLNGTTFFDETVTIQNPSVGISNALTIQVHPEAVLSVHSVSTSFSETVRFSGDATVFVVRYADQFIIKPAGEPLLID